MREEELEKMRVKAKKRERIVCIAACISFLFYGWLFYLAMKEEDLMSLLFIVKVTIVAAVAALGTMVILWYIVVKPAYDKFNGNFKSEYVLQIIGQIPGFARLEYIPKKGFSWDDVKNAAILNCGDKRYFESEDMLTGEYRDIRFQISDVTTKKMVRRDKKNRVEEIFSGQLICLYRFDELKVSKGYLQIFEREFLSDTRGWKAPYEIHTENEVFNNRFLVYASDEHNAYYILTPQRMEEIIRFADAVDGQVSLVFNEENLFVAVKGDSMFDASLEEPVSEQTGRIAEDADFIQRAGEILVLS